MWHTHLHNVKEYSVYTYIQLCVSVSVLITINTNTIKISIRFCVVTFCLFVIKYTKVLLCGWLKVFEWFYYYFHLFFFLFFDCMIFMGGICLNDMWIFYLLLLFRGEGWKQNHINTNISLIDWYFYDGKKLIKTTI